MPTTPAAANRESMELAFEAFNRHDPEAVRATAAEGYVDHEAPPELGSGFDATKLNVQRLFEGFPDVHWEVLDLVTDDRRGAARLRMTGTHEGPFMGIDPTGRAIDVEMVDFLHFDEEGQVTAHWGYMNQLELMQQLGAMPAMASQGS